MSRPIALLSVSDKTGIVALGQRLSELGWQILSTGGTGRALTDAGIEVTPVSEYTGAPEVFSGRVKTLHPKIHGGILGRRDKDQAEAIANEIRWIDLVAVNLYPFEQTVSDGEPTLAEAIEKIDIGGPTMVRAAAKNHRDVVIVVDPADYEDIANRLATEEGVSDADRADLALKAFRHTAAYDSIIASWLGARVRPGLPDEGGLPFRQVQGLRYGENPHQQAVFCAEPAAGGRSLARMIQHQGKHLSYNNIADLDAALRAVFDLDGPACVVVKHANPCGAAVHPDGPARAFQLALSADPVSAFGGIVVFNRPIDGDDVRALRQARTFFEIVAAPGYTEQALERLTAREKLRVLELPADWASSTTPGFDVKRVQGGWLLQSWDQGSEFEPTVATQRGPSDEETACLDFAWRICRHVKSNAIVLAVAQEGGFVLNGVGAGQMSRVDAVRLATEKARRPIAGSVLASDAFFPFPDGVEIASKAGVSAIIQPGASIRDDEVIAMADAHNVAMVFTGVRHFRH